MRHTAALLLVALTILALGCTSTSPATTMGTVTTTTAITTSATTSATTAPTTLPPEPVLSPVLVNDAMYEYMGDVWVPELAFWRNDTTGHDQVRGQSLIGGQAAYQVKSVPNQDSPQAYTISSFTVDGYQLLREETYSDARLQSAVYYAPALSLGFPLRSGTSANFNSTATYRNESGAVTGVVEFNYTITVEYAGAVQVPMGTYDCHRITQFVPGSNVTFLHYYSSQVGYFVVSSVFAGGQLIEQWRLVRAY